MAIVKKTLAHLIVALINILPVINRFSYLRSLNYRQLVDKTSGFLRSKDAKGHFRPNIDALNWGEDYTEGSSYQNSFACYHDILGYIRLIGGKDVFAKRLENLCNQDPQFQVHGYPGDEDNGSMSSSYLLNSLGFYPVTPGTGQYLIGIPNFDKACLYLPNGKHITINCKGNVPQYQFVHHVHYNHQAYHKLYLTHEDHIQGCQLDFQLGLVPPHHHYSSSDLPYSLTT
ncbi:alpha-1,2-mannosidase [Streptococcus dysgalactiae subsp. dysgalactiae ATCC 27957]|nr:glycoside hydrolase domain-containing protein [Streptococcus dysgalactiae]EFY03225.1 alpha-1,2-mannosidase [Streptococcus dysgalactiae subsp. dysgalactiae ATCC 27957]